MISFYLSHIVCVVFCILSWVFCMNTFSSKNDTYGISGLIGGLIAIMLNLFAALVLFIGAHYEWWRV